MGSHAVDDIFNSPVPKDQCELLWSVFVRCAAKNDISSWTTGPNLK